MSRTERLDTVHSMDTTATLFQPGANLLIRVCVWCEDESGVTAIEYGLIAALIAVACIAAFTTTGLSLGDMYEKWTNTVIAALK